jgi:GNAT superfamily N-acetyltransferase
MPALIRRAVPADFAAWLRLWQGYNAFYGRSGPTALPDAVTAATWARFLDPDEPMHCLVAEQDGALMGLVHYLFHRSTTMLAPNCYLADLFTVVASRGQGLGRALIEAVCAEARALGLPRVYWQTHETNTTAQALYNKVAQRSGFIVYRVEV